MTAEAWVTLAVVVATVGLLVTERFPPPFTMFGAVTVLLVLGVVEPAEALSGFSNPAPVTVAALYVLAGAADVTGALDGIAERMLGRGDHGQRTTIGRIILPTAVSSAFLNNTPIVAMVAPRVVMWCRRRGVPPSRFLMPISYAAVLGGLVTIMGTSTNVVVAGLLVADGQRALGFFELAAVGLPLAAIGLLALVVLAPLLLPERRGASHDLLDPREFTIEMVVRSGSPLIGRSVTDAGLRALEGVFLVEIERDGQVMAPVEPTEVLVEDDRLTFAGNVKRILDLQRMPGLASAEERHFAATAQSAARFFEVVVAPGSELAGSTIKAAGFRGRYGGAVVAVHRSGERVAGKLGEIELRGGDVLLVVGPPGFPGRQHDHRDFAVMAPLSGAVPVRQGRSWIVGVAGAGIVALAATGIVGLLEASLLAAGALVLTRTVTAAEARQSVDLSVVILLAASFGLGAAIASSGLATTVADGLVNGLGGFGDIGVLAGVLVGTMLLTELVTNNAAAVLMFPVAMAVASQSGLDPRPLAIAVAVGASASFLTPIGYQTNTMVYGIGGYRFSDFSRLGAPITAITIATSLALIPLAWPLR